VPESSTRSGARPGSSGASARPGGALASRALVASARRPHVSVEESRLVREHDCLDAVAEVELLEDVGDVCLDGGVADVELFADLGVQVPEVEKVVREGPNYVVVSKVGAGAPVAEKLDPRKRRQA
jgi:hypothetical protein